MKTQTPAPQSRSDMLALTNILVPLDFSPPSGNAASKARMMEPTAESMAARLARHPFLAGINQEQLALLADCATTVQFQKEQVIFREGDVADRILLVETGKVNLESSGGLGDPMLGWAWMLSTSCLDLHGARGRTNHRDLFRRRNPTGVLRERLLVRLRVLEAHEFGHVPTHAGNAG